LKRDLGLPLDYPGDRWKCPTTGIVIAKDIAGNLEQRQHVLTLAENPDERPGILAICKASKLAWINLFAWTHVVVEQTATGRKATTRPTCQPLVTWPVQDAVIESIQKCEAAGQSLLIPKSREMGASWICLADAVHDCLFKPGSSILLVSRKEELVEKQGNPDSLMWKVDYLLDHLPHWMQPRRVDVHLQLTFPDLGTSIAGDTTNDDAGRGGRRTKILIDEAAAVDNLRAIDNATQDSTPCRVFISTPRRGSYFGMMQRSGKIPIVSMLWYNHPEKARGRKLVTDPVTKEKRYTAPWYEAEIAKRVDAQDIAENLDVDDEGSAALIDSRTIDLQASMFGRDPVRLSVRLPESVRLDRSLPLNEYPMDLLEAREEARGLWRWWGALHQGRPVQGRQYVAGVDVGQGVGRSDSVVSVWDAETMEKVGRWSSNTLMPSDFADGLFLWGAWIGGKGGVPLLVIESNGPGTAVIMRLRKLGYTRMYRHVDMDSARPKVSDEYGWHSTRTSKREVLETYRGYLARHEAKNPDREALEQARAYTAYEEGGVGPIILAGMTQEQRDQHGDMVIADMLGVLGCLRIPFLPAPKVEAPFNSIEWRKQQRAKRERDRDKFND
jgi:hypothetical protein